MSTLTINPSDYILSTSRDYSIYVCSERAIPMVADGLKNGQRVALWVLRNKSDKIKTCGLSGTIISLGLYVHGDTSLNNTISLLAAPYKNNHCLIEGIGAFGTRVAPDKEGIGASRYTSVKKSKAADAFLYHDLDLVPLEENYDGSNKQPKHFLPIIPTVLLNGVKGVAIGWAVEILPRSLDDLVNATKAALLGKEVQTLVPNWRKYDVAVEKGLKENQWIVSGKVDIVGSSTLRVTELPPEFSIEGYRKILCDMEDKEIIQGFSDRSTDRIDISVKMKRGSIKDWNAEQAIDFLKLRSKVSERIVVIDWSGKSIRQYTSAEDVVRDFAAWRLKYYTLRYERLVAENSHELLYWQALHILFQEDFTKKLGKFTNKTEMLGEVVSMLASQMTLDADQLDRIVGLPTYKWTAEFFSEVEKKVESLYALVLSYKETLESPDKLKKIYISELDALKSSKAFS